LRLRSRGGIENVLFMYKLGRKLENHEYIFPIEELVLNKNKL
jgi:hypothetical protein